MWGNIALAQGATTYTANPGLVKGNRASDLSAFICLSRVSAGEPRGYDQCAQAYEQAKRGEWAEAEKSLLEGSRRLPPLSQWVPNFVTQVEQRRGDVSGLLLATEADRDGMVGLVPLSLQSAGCHAGKT